mgnify:CR=1 FL=1
MKGSEANLTLRIVSQLTNATEAEAKIALERTQWDVKKAATSLAKR